MKKNVGGLDQGIRITLGPMLVVAAVGSLLGKLRLGSAATAAAFAVGAILTATGLTQTCPANSVMGRDTYRPSDDLTEEAQQIRERAVQ
ncbi:YgaP family membrane protein [Halorussus litoreus]|uniref:YgaP family membrane protein n=1 Tax=Halorussus litoreus TaxID=1710536 RepID=UPI000E28482A|nr:DUF2892 domain-containing protein [Halorussus litoreus]